MIKFRVTKPNGQHLYGFGLSEMNVQRMKEKKPVNFKFDDMEVIIFYGDTEEALMEELKPFIGPDTEVRNEL